MVRRLLAPVAAIAATTIVLLILFPRGFPNYDTIYYLLWGTELAQGLSPDRAAPLSPTPHPLAELFGLLTAPLGEGAVDLTMLVAYASLGLVAYLVYRLGSLWFDRAIGAAAAAIVLPRAPFISNGLRAYIDLPYIALCLAALVIETKRPRAGGPVLGLLVGAGLLRPEAWLFSAAYLAYLVLDLEQDAGGRPRLRWREGYGLGKPALYRLASLALAAPLLWAFFDWITAGSPTYSFTGTRETVETLERQTGPVDLVLYGPRRLGEVLQWPGMVGAAGGLLLGFAFLRRRSCLGIAAAALALAAFTVLATAGLAIIPRYTMLAAAILAVFAALALLGWRLLEPGHPWRRAWQTFAALIALMLIAWAPNQYHLLQRVDVDLTNQGAIENDLNELARSGAFEPLCGPISVPNHRAIPRLGFGLDVRPNRIISPGEQQQPRRGYFLDPATAFTVHNFILDPNDTTRFASTIAVGLSEVARTESWVLYRRC